MWIVNYLNSYTSGYSNKIEVSGVDGYWTISSSTTFSTNAWYVSCDDYTNVTSVNSSGSLGIRPVIILKI